MLPLNKRSQLNYWSIALAFVLWAAMFRSGVQAAINFWAMMPVATVLLASLAFIANYPLMNKNEWSGKNIVIGVGAAIALWGIFWLGNGLANFAARQFPGLIPNKAAQLQSIYTQGSGVSRPVIGMLLFFPIGMCEEIFWRGMVQKIAEERYGRMKGLIFTIFFYTAVHVSTFNLMLILAAFTCGAFWGLLYYYTRSILPGVVSHMIWDPLIFAVLPIV